MRGDGAGVGEEFLHGARFGQHAAEGEAGNFETLTKAAKLADAFAHERGSVKRAFAGENEVHAAQAAHKVGVARKQGEAGLEFRAEKQAQAEAESAGRAGAGFLGAEAGELRLGHAGELSQIFFRDGKVFGAQAFLRAVDARTAARAEQRILHIDGDDGGGEKAAAAARRLKAGESMEFGPGFNVAVVAVEEAPAERAGHAEAGVVGGAAADADEAAARARGGGGEEELAEAAGVELEGMKLFRRQQCEADGAGGFDHGGAARRLEPPAGVVWSMRGIDDVSGLFVGVELSAENRAEAIATVAHGDKLEVVVRAREPPTGGDGRAGGFGGQGAFEFVGDDEDAERHGWVGKVISNW